MRYKNANGRPCVNLLTVILLVSCLNLFRNLSTQSLEGKIAAHYAEAAALFAREREEKTRALKRSAAAVAAAEAPRNTVAGAPGTSETRPPLPPSVVDSLEPDGLSRWVSGGESRPTRPGWFLGTGGAVGVQVMVGSASRPHLISNGTPLLHQVQDA